ncbi:MAG: polysaccharide deacetylase family protein [Minisyncoccales bacterium]
MKKVFFTFDDGPNEHTLKILEILKNFEAQATFFVCGKNCKKFPEILKKIFEEGHCVGNHSFSHSIKFFFDFKNEIEKTNMIIKEILQIETKIFRPPWGFLTPWLKNYLFKNGYKTILWDIDSQDWRGKISDKIFKKIKPNSILLFHNCQITCFFLPKILEKLKKEGYETETLLS